MKNYVREYRGCRVPVKATHFAEVTGYNHPAFYSDNHIWVIFEDSLHCHQNSCIPRNAIELPEAPQEWMTNKTIYWVAKVDKYGTPWNFDGPHSSYEDANSSIVLLNSLSSDTHIVTEMKFKTLKTKQEKDREAFIDAAIRAVEKECLPHDFAESEDLMNAISAMFKTGFTAPKAADNESL